MGKKKKKSSGRMVRHTPFLFDQSFDNEDYSVTEVKLSRRFLKSFSSLVFGSKGSVHTSKLKYIT